MPKLVAELLRRNWTDEEVKAALGNNLLRVFREAENVRESQTRTRTRTQTQASTQRHEPLKLIRIAVWPHTS